MLKFTCEKTPLFSAVAVASRTVAQKSPISVLEGIHLRAEQDTLSLGTAVVFALQYLLWLL